MITLKKLREYWESMIGRVDGLKSVVDSRRPCHFLKVDNTTISTLPETEFFGNWAGWSIGFTTKSY